MKPKKEKWSTINALVGSIIVTPKEVQAFKKRGFDLLVFLKKVQREIYKKRK